MSEGQVDRVAGALGEVLGRGRALVRSRSRMSRFAEPQHQVFRRLNDSIGFDRRLGPYDIEQSRAHAAMLAAQGIITEADRDALHAGLDQVQDELGDGSFPFADGDEDIHMAIERRVTEIAGAVGGRLHTARSRNDQVATDVAMFVRAHAFSARHGRGRAREHACRRRRARTSTGRCRGTRTCSERSRCISSHHLLAYVWMLVRDRDRFLRGRRRDRRLPLGAGALAGVNFDTDRALVAASSGSTSVAAELASTPSRTATSCSTTSRLPTCATHLSRLGAEIVLWSSEEFGFCEVSDAWASGSLDHAAEEEPGRGRVAAREGTADRRRT